MNKNEKKYNYFYKITNKINDKFYYGIRSTDKEPEMDNYFGSGSALRQAIKKYGKENFKKEIIADYPTRKEASDHEKLIVTVELIQLEECYNCKTGGDNGFTYKHTDKWKSEMSVCMSGKNNPFYGKCHSVETRERLSGEGNGMFGKTHTYEAKKKISDAQTGDKNHNFGKSLSEKTKRKLSDANSGENNPNFGKPRNEKTKEKLRHNSDCKPCQILGIVYYSMSEAARQLGLSKNDVSKRLRANDIEFSEWFYLNINNSNQTI